MFTNKNMWLFLVLLTVAGYFLSESSTAAKGLVTLIVVLYSIKFIGIGFQFMELKKAHVAWKLALIFTALFFVVFISISYNII